MQRIKNIVNRRAGILILTFIVGALLCPMMTLAQEIDFLPRGVFRFSYDINTTTTEKILADGEGRESLLNALLSRYSIPDTGVEGSIKYETVKQKLELQVGVFNSWNFGITIPYLTNKRISDLEVESGSTAQQAFKERFKSAETSGVGDLEYWGIWRPHYSDEFDFRLVFKLIGDNAPLHYGKSDEVALGSGTKDLVSSLKWKYYPKSYPMMLEFESGLRFTENSTVTDDSGESRELKKGRDIHMSIASSYNLNRFNYGGRIRLINKAPTIIDDTQQNDGYIAYTYRLFLNVGNLYMLESTTVNLPWNAQIYMENTFFGSNAPDARVIGLKATTYF